MSEIEKLYENANIKSEECCERDSDACMTCCHEWENRQDCWKYKSVIPPFTAEKQLELIKWLATRELKIKTQKQPCVTYIGTLGQHECFYGIEETHFEQALAGVINYLWQNLTKEEKQEIKRILE